MQILPYIREYCKYRFTSRTKFDIHPPFLFDLVTRVFEDNGRYAAYGKVEDLKKELLADKRKIKVTDYGAGSSVDNGNEREVGRIAKYSSKRKKHGRLIFRLVKYFQPDTIIELGTSLGLSTAYMALANPEAKIITVEGCPNISKIARENFQRLGLSRIELITGRFDEVLPGIIERCGKTDFVFIDGNHRKEPTVKYFEQCLKTAHNDTVFLFDDIHWSQGMTEAWEIISGHDEVTLSVDIFAMGIVFLKKELSKERYVVKF